MCAPLRPFVVILLTASPWPCTARAHADAPDPLGTAGQWIVGGDAGGTYEQRSTKGEAAAVAFVDVEHFSVWVAPSALHFVATDFALGGSVFAGVDRYERADGVAIDEFGLGASAALAYRAGLGPRLFLLPKLAIGATRVARAVSSSRPSVLRDDDAFLRWTPAGARESALSEALPSGWVS